MLDVVLYCLCFLFSFCLYPCVVINVSVQNLMSRMNGKKTHTHTHTQYNGGLLPCIILLTQQRYYHRETHSNAMKRFCTCSLWWSHLNVLTFSPLTGGCSEVLDAFRFFFKQLSSQINFLSNALAYEKIHTASDQLRIQPNFKGQTRKARSAVSTRAETWSPCFSSVSSILQHPTKIPDKQFIPAVVSISNTASSLFELKQTNTVLSITTVVLVGLL